MSMAVNEMEIALESLSQDSQDSNPGPIGREGADGLFKIFGEGEYFSSSVSRLEIGKIGQ